MSLSVGVSPPHSDLLEEESGDDEIRREPLDRSTPSAHGNMIFLYKCRLVLQSTALKSTHNRPNTGASTASSTLDPRHGFVASALNIANLRFTSMWSTNLVVDCPAEGANMSFQKLVSLLNSRNDPRSHFVSTSDAQVAHRVSHPPSSTLFQQAPFRTHRPLPVFLEHHVFCVNVVQRGRDTWRYDAIGVSCIKCSSAATGDSHLWRL